MRWIEEPNKSFPKWPHHVLLVEDSEPLQPAWVEYWKRILTEGFELPRGSRAALAIDIYARTFEKDSMGQTTAKFNNSVNRQAEEIGTYELRSDQFTLLQGEGEDDDDFGRRQLVWFLGHYQILKGALRDRDVWPLYQRINASFPLRLRLATINGWFDLQPDQEKFGELPYEDQELMAGMEPASQEPMAALGAGVLTATKVNAIEELSEALIQYTPPHFQTIRCTIREGVEQGRRALFYQIESPEYPNDGTTVANERVHRAATLLVQQLAPQGSFTGIRIELHQQANGTWERSVEPVGQPG